MTDPDTRDHGPLSHIPPQTQDWPGRTGELRPRPDHGEDRSGRDLLRGRRALVTGGDSGIGRAVALAFAREGATVTISHLEEESADARDTLAAVEAAGGTAYAFAHDLRTAEANERLARESLEAMGGLDVLVCNAAYQMSHDDLEGFPPEQIVRTFETNVFSPFWLVRALRPSLRDGGCVLMTTSIQAYEPSSHLLDYAATKAALNNLVVNLAASLGPEGIRVNAVAPGPIWTPLIPATMPAEKVEGFGSDTPLGRAGEPAEVAEAFVFLASAAAAYVSGTVLGVTGGKPVF